MYCYSCYSCTYSLGCWGTLRHFDGSWAILSHDPHTWPLSPHHSRLSRCLWTSRCAWIYNLSSSTNPPSTPFSEDTFILLDALEADLDFLIDLRPSICVEIGWVVMHFGHRTQHSHYFFWHLPMLLRSGSGCVSVFVQKILSGLPNREIRISIWTTIHYPNGKLTWPSTVHICTDINPQALRLTDSTFQKNSLPVPNLVHTSLLNSLRLESSVDLLLFNPPYVETSTEEYVEATGGLIEASWAGGVSGMELTNQLLESLNRLLSPSRGVLYLVAVKENKPQEILERMNQRGFDAQVCFDGTSWIDSTSLTR